MHVEWKSLKGIVECGDNYEISNRREVRNVLTGTIRKPQLCKNKKRTAGYMQINLNKKKYYVHRLVALAFIPNPENKPTVNHISGNHFDNSVENLEWASFKEQGVHASENGLMRGRGVIQIDKFSGEILAEYDSVTEASKKTGVGITTICQQCKTIGNSRKYNFYFRYK